VKAALLSNIGTFEIRDIPLPKITNDTDILIRTRMVGVCGSDIHYYTTGRIGSQIVEYPFIVGHEAGGIVEKVGVKVTRVKPGQRIAIDPAVSCGQCDQCLIGRQHTCRKLLFLGCPQQLDGALKEFMVLPEKCCYPIADSLTWEQAVLSEPLAVAVYTVEQSRLPENGNVAILGVGPIGMSVFHVLRTKKVNHIYITDKIKERLDLASALHPDWSGNPDTTDIVEEILKREALQLDVVYECSGDPEAINQALQLLKPGGILTIVGIPEVDTIPFPIHELRRQEITIVNIRRQVRCTLKALDLLTSNQVNIEALATHHFSLNQIQQAFNLVAHYRDGVMKAMIEFD
jgi:L-iditol 2-dehydrogenase